MNVRVFVEAVWLGTVLPVLGVAIWLLCVTVTLSGALVGAGLIALIAPVPLLGFRHRFSAKTRAVAGVLIGMGLAMLLVAWWRVPRPAGDDIRLAGPRSIYSGPAVYRSWTPSSLVPEVDQHLMGVCLFSALDRRIRGPSGARLGASIRRIYGEMDRDPAFRGLPGALGICYAEMFGSDRVSGHRFVYVPDRTGAGPMPAILFLHGSMGNFSSYLWVWKRVADARGWVIVAPSHGVGEWRDAAGMDEVRRALSWCRSQPEIDPGRIVLAGLSNGGAGVTRAAPEIAEEIAGLIYLSPIIDPDTLSAPGYGHKMSRPPVLVITGAMDDRADEPYVARGVRAWRKIGSEVEYHAIDGEDHFLFFSQPERVTDLVAAWLDAAVQNE